MNLEDMNVLMSEILAMTDLFREMLNQKFTETEFFDQMNMDPIFKQYLKEQTIGNHSMIQLMLYLVLVVPKELFDEKNYKNIKKEYCRVNSLIYEQVEESLSYSTYDGEEDFKSIDYLRHLRNAVAHSNCEYLYEKDFVGISFYDKNNRDEKCKISLRNKVIVRLLNELRQLILDFFKQYIPVEHDEN